MVIGYQGIQAHQPTHGAAGNKGSFPLRQGGILGVYHGLEFLNQPFHGPFAPATDTSQIFFLKREGRILGKAGIVGCVIALRCHDDQWRLGLVHVFLHAPAFAIGGVLVEKNVMAIEHVQHGVAGIGVRGQRIGDIYINPPGLLTA